MLAYEQSPNILINRKETPLIDKVADALIREVRATLESGLSIAVVGWRDSNHDAFTRGLPKQKVIFLEASALNVPERAGYLLFTRFVYHTQFNRLRKGRSHYPGTLETGEIKRLLRSCADLLLPALAQSAALPVPEGMTEVQAAEAALAVQELGDDVLDFLTTPKEKHEMSEMDKFVEAFQKEAAANKEVPDAVGKKILGKLIDQILGKAYNAQKLAKDHWIEGVRRVEGGPIGYWKAGPKMQQATKDLDQEPDDPYELAKFLVRQKPSIEAELAKLQKKLARVETAEKVLAQLDQLKGAPQGPSET